MNTETESNFNLFVSFIQRIVKQNKLSLTFTKNTIFPHKTVCFLSNLYNALKLKSMFFYPTNTKLKPRISSSQTSTFLSPIYCT